MKLSDNMRLKNLKFKPKIFWIGPLVPSYCFKDWLAASPAAMKWQKHLVEALVEKGIDAEWLYYRPDPYWPIGRLLPSISKIQSKTTFKKKQIKYVNILGLKNFTLEKSLKKILKTKTKSNGFQPLIIISYNSTKWINKIFLDQNINKKFICIYIVADYEVPKGANGYVFLSYDSFNKYDKDYNKLHLDGAVYPSDQRQSFQQSNRKKSKIIFFYSGSFHKWGGVKILLDAMNYIKDDKLELWISGQGDNKLIKLAVKKDKRIKFLGLLSNNRLQNTYNRVDIFLNPRPVNMPGNEINFPSKLFDYLAWDKPIISTWTKSLSPIYKKVLHVVDDNPVAIAFAMSSYLKVKKFSKTKTKDLINKKSWSRQADKLINFIKKIYSKI
jgi:glycosyltransferase involved in cell wall biosynthesis